MFDDVLQHLLIERQVGHDPLQPTVIFLELPQSFHLRRHQSAGLLAPIVICRLTDPRLSADIFYRRAFFALTQHECDLALAIFLASGPVTTRTHNEKILAQTGPVSRGQVTRERIIALIMLANTLEVDDAIEIAEKIDI